MGLIVSLSCVEPFEVNPIGCHFPSLCQEWVFAPRTGVKAWVNGSSPRQIPGFWELTGACQLLKGKGVPRQGAVVRPSKRKVGPGMSLGIQKLIIMQEPEVGPPEGLGRTCNDSVYPGRAGQGKHRNVGRAGRIPGVLGEGETAEAVGGGEWSQHECTGVHVG